MMGVDGSQYGYREIDHPIIYPLDLKKKTPEEKNSSTIRGEREVGSRCREEYEYNDTPKKEWGTRRYC